MTYLNQTIRTTTKSLLCALLLCICLCAAGLVIAHVQAAPHESESAFQTESDAVPAHESHNAEATDLTGEDESTTGERPGSSDQHNSTGDDILVRIPR